MQEKHVLDVDGAPIAVRTARPEGGAKAPGLVWLGGYRSDMAGTKALVMEEWALANGHASIRFDYSGHGESGGEFRNGTISRWMGEAMAVIEAFAEGPQLLVGSSMGAWIALRLVRALAERGESARVAGLLLLAPAPDFTSELMEPELTEEQKADLEAKGYFEVPTPYGPEPNVFTKALFDDGRASRVMTGPIDTHCPVHIIQGKADPDVPWQHAMRLFELLSRDDATIAFVPDGDHRLSRPQDLDMIRNALAMLCHTV